MRTVLAAISLLGTFASAAAGQEPLYETPATAEAPMQVYVPELLQGRWARTPDLCAAGQAGAGLVSFTGSTVTIDGSTAPVPAPITSGQTYLRVRVTLPVTGDANWSQGERDLSFSVIGSRQLNLVEYVGRHRQLVATYERCPGQS